jgi:ribosome-associated protein
LTDKNTPAEQNSSDTVPHRIAALMLEKKALNVKIIDVREITTLTDFFVLCISESEPQTRAIADHINLEMKKEGVESWHIEGYQHLDWVLVDFVNIVAHIFSKEAWDYYEFERLWADGKIIEVKDKIER